MHVKGKPVGHVYVVHGRLEATSKDAAMRALKQNLASWNKIKTNKREGFSAQAVKVKRLVKTRKESDPVKRALRQLF
jgi:hypothetical protein